MNPGKESRAAAPEPKYRVEVNLDPFAPREKMAYVYEMPSSPSSDEGESGDAEPSSEAAGSSKSGNQEISEESQHKESKVAVNETGNDAEQVDAPSVREDEPQETYVVETLVNTDFEGKVRIYRPEPHVFVPENVNNHFSANMQGTSFPVMGNATFYPNPLFPERYPFSPDFQRYNGHWGFPENEQDNINWWRTMHECYSRYDWMSPGFDFSRQYYEQRYYQQRFPCPESGDYGYGYLQRFDRHGQSYNSPRYQPYFFGQSPDRMGYMRPRPESSVYSGSSEYSGRSEHSLHSPSTSHSTGHGSPHTRHGGRARGRSLGYGQWTDECGERLPVSETAIKQMRDCLSDLKKKIAKGRRASSRTEYKWNCRVKEFIEENLANALSVNKALGKKK